MDDVIHAEKIEKLLNKDGDIVELIALKEQSELKKVLLMNRANWSQISMLPEFVFHQFNMRMRRECFVTESRMAYPPKKGPHIIFENRNDKISIKIDDTDGGRSMARYRKDLAVVAYYIGIVGGKISPKLVDGVYCFSDEDWILISIAARYCLMPARYIQKIYVLTQMDTEKKGKADGKTFLRVFIDNLVKQTDLPEKIVISRLHEHAFFDGGLSNVITKRSIADLVEEYRNNEHYTDMLV